MFKSKNTRGPSTGLCSVSDMDHPVSYFGIDLPRFLSNVAPGPDKPAILISDMDEINQWITGLFGNKDQSDIELHVEVVQEHHTFVLPGHSFVLRHVSRVFDVMLEPGKFQEGTTGVADIKVYGSKADAVFCIKYLYTKKLQSLDTNTCVALMKTADFYEMNKLREECEKRILACLTPFSVCSIYSVLSNISSEGFRDYCEAMMLKFAFLIFDNNMHVTLSKEAMTCLLRSEKLVVLNQEQVLRATWEWGHSKCIIENVLGTKKPEQMINDLLPLIKWEGISALETKFPWFKKCNPTTYPLISFFPCTTSVKLATENIIPLYRFSNALKIYQNVNPSDNVSVDDKLALIAFTPDHRVLLTGLKIQVMTQVNTLPADFSPNIFANTFSINSTCYETAIPKRAPQTNNIYYYHILTLDFCKPVLLKSNKINVIYLQRSVYNFQVQQLNLTTEALQSGISGPDKVCFSVHGSIFAIQKIFYFIQD